MSYIRDRWKESGRYGKNPDSRWQVWVTVDGRQKYVGAYRTKAIANRHKVEHESRAQRGAWVDTSNTTTVTELVRADLERRIHRGRTAERSESYVRNHVAGTPFGDLRVVSVRPGDVQAWVTDRAAVLSPRTVRNLAGMVRAAFDAAVLDRIIARTPFERIVLPRVEQDRVVPLTIAQVDDIVAAIRPRYQAMVRAQAGLGLRLGELLALRVEDVNFLARTVRVEDQIDRSTRERVPPKTPKSRRTLPLPDVVARALARHIEEFPPAPSGLLFATRDGLPLDHDWYANKVFAVAAEKTGLPRGTNTHALRHHFASVLLGRGQAVTAVAELLGHEDATLVTRVYAHIMPGAEDLARKAIDAAWSEHHQSTEKVAVAQGRPQ